MSEQTMTAFPAAGASVSRRPSERGPTPTWTRVRPAGTSTCAPWPSTSSGPAGPSSEPGRPAPSTPRTRGAAKAQLDDAAWAEQLAGQVDRLAAAWSRPEAWDRPIDGAQMPTEAIGEMGLLELMLHGWDVARATGQSLEVPAELGAELLRCLLPTLEQGREYEVYGPEVSVPEDASDFDRALGLSGRDPQWSA